MNTNGKDGAGGAGGKGKTRAPQAENAPGGGRTTARHFIFCTGIENSYPVITTREGKRLRRDGMALSGHYEHWREDFGLVKELGLDFLRYGPPYYKCHVGPMRYDWSWPDKTFPVLREMGIHPITDLCHFGVPDWVGGFQDPEWPPLYADYVRGFAERFPWVRFYTPVNEIFIAARFSGQLGWWNEQQTGSRSFVSALKNLARANLLAEEAILRVQPAALFIQSESGEYFHPASPAARAKATFFNEERFLSLDLCYGHDVASGMFEYLTDNGMSREEYHWLMDHGSAMRPHCVMGTDYYATNEHLVLDGDGRTEPSGEIFGYYVIAKQYFDRYHLPIMHTETNRKDADAAPAWLRKEWANVVRLKDDGIPILGFTWYSLIDQTDWDTALREDNRRNDPTGLYDKDRKIRKVGEAYKRLIAEWRDQLPLDSMSRDMFIEDHHHPQKVGRQARKPEHDKSGHDKSAHDNSPHHKSARGKSSRGASRAGGRKAKHAAGHARH